MLGQVVYMRFAVHLLAGEHVPWDTCEKHPDLGTMAVQFRCLQCKRDPCGDHGIRSVHTRGKPFSRRSDGFASPELAFVVDYVEKQLDQLEGCINSTFANGTGDPKESMLRFADLKSHALRDLQSLLASPGSGDGSNRLLDQYPAASWACTWPLTSQA